MQTPQERARLEQIKRSWQHGRRITERLADIEDAIGIYSGKGGVANTSVAVNLAATLAVFGRLNRAQVQRVRTALPVAGPAGEVS